MVAKVQNLGIDNRSISNYPGNMQAETCNGLKSVGTICYRAYGSCSSTFQNRRLDHIFSRAISIPCEKLKCAHIHLIQIFSLLFIVTS
jgi:hypothetical protein